MIDKPGLWARISGADIRSFLVTIIIMLIGAGLLWQIIHANKQFSSQAAHNAKQFLEQHTVTQGLQRDIIRNQSDIIRILADSQSKLERAQTMQTYVLTLSQQERSALKLAAPDALKGAR